MSHIFELYLNWIQKGTHNWVEVVVILIFFLGRSWTPRELIDTEDSIFEEEN